MATRKTPASKLSFSDAVAEVEDIVNRLENEETDVDALSDEVKRAVELISVCKARLEKTDLEVRELVGKLAPPVGAPEPDIPQAAGD